MAITNSDSAITITTDPTNRILSFVANNYPSIGVTGTFTSTLSGSTNSINNTTIGSQISAAGRFTSLNSTGTTTFSNNLTIAPTGTGTLTINSGSVGFANNMLVGSIKPAIGRFSSLTLTQATNAGNNLINLAQVKKLLLLGAIQ